MKTHQDAPKKLISSIVALLLVSIAWVSFAPIQFGGQTAYVIISGNSMEPRFHLKDLVILHQASSYQVGDIATYDHPEVGPIIHRIIAQEGDRFVFKGDNNDWTDSYRPTSDEIIGKFWLHVPHLGKYLERLRSPWILAFITAVIGLIMTTPTLTSNQEHRPALANQPSQLKNQLGVSKSDLFSTLAMLALASLLLAIFAFTRPSSRPVANNITYEQSGQFSYSAAAPPGIYTSDTVQPGEPIFRRLIDKINVSFNYQLATDQPANLSGTYQLVAEISHSNGWRWPFDLQPATAFSGNTYSTTAELDLAQVQSIINNLEEQTGLQGQQFTLTIKPQTNISGIMAGQILQDTFSPRLVFTLNDLQMRLDKESSLKPLQAGTIELAGEEPNTISVFNFQFKVATVRQVALAGVILSLGGMLFVGLLMFHTGHQSAAARLQEKYGSLLVAVQDSDLGLGGRTVEVTTIDDLAKIAGRNGRMILYQSKGAVHHYFVQDNDTTYHYRLVEERAKRAKTPVMKVRPL